MPQVFVYIRNDDLDKWKAVEKKSLFIHEALNTQIIKGDVLPPIKPSAIPGVVRGADFVPKPPDPETGYPCCTKKRPCRHWHFNGEEGMWVNELTGATKET